MKRINNDVNGNPRYVVHFYDLLTDIEGLNLTILQRYELALKKARKVGGKMYRGKDFGGGIVFQSYNIIETINKAKGAI
jgi:hypothetical protein